MSNNTGMALQDYNFEDYLIDPTLPDDELIARFDQYDEFKTPLGKELPLYKVIRYIILMYDMYTEMGQIFPDIFLRKREVAQLAGFEMKKKAGIKKFHPDVSQFLVNKNQFTTQMILRYVRMFNNPDYITYVSYWTMLTDQVLASMDPGDAQDVGRIRKNIQDLNRDISVLTTSIFKGDSSRELIKSLYASMEEEQLRLRPEDIANDIKDDKVDVAEGQWTAESSLQGI